MIANKERYLADIDAVIEKGPFSDTWASLAGNPIPEWYQNAKFGIFIHWGVYSVPAFGSEWYPRQMYIEGTREYKHHLETYGPHKDFGYADFIPMFKGERFDAGQWADLFAEAGARYIMPVAEHHDGFQMYDSSLSDWNASKMGPCRDIVGELKTASEKRGMAFCVSSHRAENYWFFNGVRTFDSGLEDISFQEPYGYASPVINNKMTHDIHSSGPVRDHLEEWLIRTCELVDKYQPKVVWFDWWIQNMSFKPWLKKFAAYYYNLASEWGEQVTINYKYDAYAYSTAVFDIERGQLSGIRPLLWQNDTAVAKNSWGYTDNNDFKKPEDLVCDLVDIVSKNGCLLLNVGPKSDGTITQEDQDVLRAIGKWLKTNGESIYGTTFWNTFGEGNTEVPEGAFTDVGRAEFTSQDIRFTYKAPHVFANVLSWPNDNHVRIVSLKTNSRFFLGHVEGVELIGFDNPISFKQTGEALDILVEGTISTTFPVCLKIEID
jgi:alpha-L-fucosidase